MRGKERRTIVGIELREWCVRGCCTAVWPLLCPFFGRRVGPPPFLLFLSFPMPFVQLLLSVTLPPPLFPSSPFSSFFGGGSAGRVVVVGGGGVASTGARRSPVVPTLRGQAQAKGERESVVFSTYFMSQASLVCVTV